jgi:hypothetical protein
VESATTFELTFPAIPEALPAPEFEQGFIIDAIIDTLDQVIADPTVVTAVAGVPFRRGGVLEISRKYHIANPMMFRGAHLWHALRIFSERSWDPFMMPAGTELTFRWTLKWE